MVLINTERNEFRIEFTKIKRSFTYDTKRQYKVIISFKDSMNREVLHIESNESEILHNAIELSITGNSLSSDSIIEDIVYFNSNSDMSNYFLVVSVKSLEYPTEDDMLVFSFFENTIYGNKLRLSFEATYVWLENFIYTMYCSISDLDYLETIESAEQMLEEFRYWNF